MKIFECCVPGLYYKAMLCGYEMNIINMDPNEANIL